MTYFTANTNNNHGDTFTSINDALAGTLNWALFNGAEMEDCDEVREEILKVVSQGCNIRSALQEGNFTVLTDGGFMDIGYLLSERF